MKLNRLALIPVTILSALVMESVTQAAADPLETWHVRQSPAVPSSATLSGVAFGNGRWVVVATSGAVFSSPDGAQWSEEANPAAPDTLTDVAFGNGIFVAVSSKFESMITSPDGRNWTRRSPQMSGAQEIIHDGTRFVVLQSGGYIGVSTNGSVWDSSYHVPNQFVDAGGIAFGNGKYVEVGYKRSGKPTDLYSSHDLSDWEFRDAKLNQNMMNVGFGLGLFVAVGQNGALITSPDGIEWTPRDIPHTGFIWDVATGGNSFVAAAQWGRLLTSRNGTDWSRQETDLSGHFTDVAFGNGTFVAVGWDGQIAQSDPVSTTPPGDAITLLDPQRIGNQFKFKFSAQVGKSYQVQVSTTLKQWAPLGTVVCTETPMPFSDTTAAAGRFYRIVAQ